MPWTRVVAPLVLAMLAGCTSWEGLDGGEQSIVNGTVEEGFPATVAMGAEWNGNQMGMCSANLLTPRVVLCAAHCGDGIPIEVVLTLGAAFFGTDMTDADETIAFDDFVIHPDYVGTGSLDDPQHDFSLWTLSDDATAEPTWFNREELDNTVLGTEVTSVGYGCLSWTSNEFGIKHSAVLTVDTMTDTHLQSTTSTNPDEANVCFGDSGGPQLQQQENGRWVQLAVHSYGVSYGENQPFQFSANERTDTVAPWILDYIEDVHDTRDVCEINGWYDDGVCDEYCDEPDPDCEIGDDDSGDDDASDDDDEGDDDDDDDGGQGCECSSSATPTAATILILFLPLAALVFRRF